METGQEKIITEILIDKEKSIKSLFNYAVSHGHAIAFWKLPKQNQIFLAIDNDGPRKLNQINLEESKPGFIFAPFDTTQTAQFIKGEMLYSFDFEKDNELVSHTASAAAYLEQANQYPLRENIYYTNPIEPIFQDTITDQDDYQKLVEHCKQKIADGLFEKVVPSRRIQVKLTEGIDAVYYFQKFCRSYPNTLVSLVSIQGLGTWLGASPELLVSVQNKRWFKTVALAGTQAFRTEISLKEVSWTQKEIEEQALVSRYIINCFKQIRLREFEEHGPKSVKTANLIHLKTDFMVDMIATNFPQLGTVMLNLLHPTSAVCGMPMKEAMEFLNKHEGYNREFYSGYLGPVNCFDQTHIYVNLRCMQLFDKYAVCYAGAGVTIDSNPEKEFLETEMKINGILDTLN